MINLQLHYYTYFYSFTSKSEKSVTFFFSDHCPVLSLKFGLNFRCRFVLTKPFLCYCKTCKTALQYTSVVFHPSTRLHTYHKCYEILLRIINFNLNAHNYRWAVNKVRELIAVKLLHTSLLNTTVVTFKVHLFGSYALVPAPSPPFKTIF